MGYETLNLSICADSSNDTKTDRKGKRKNEREKIHVFHLMCQVSHVTCHMSPVVCHLSLTATASATDPPC